MEELKIKTANHIYQVLGEMFPDAKCELNYNNVFELLIAVSLSAQTTDKRVNMVTPLLFEKYPTYKELENANIDDVKEIIKSIGLANTKARNIIELSKSLDELYNGVVPNTIESLTKLSGVGRKTASVIMSVGYNLPALAVDTHVSRVANRLGLSNSSNVLDIENDLKKLYSMDQWENVHHRLLFFGRYHCTAKKPMCDTCPLKKYCKV